MFDSLEGQIKAEDMEGSPKEKQTRYAVISALSAVVVVPVFSLVAIAR
jgi:hypothetical protein